MEMNIVFLYIWNLFIVWKIACSQWSAGKARTFGGNVTRKPLVDLIFFDCQENLPVPDVSSPAHAVPAWNSDPEYDALQNAFLFAEDHLQDHGCMVVFHSYCVASKGVIQGLCEAYPSLVKKTDWLGINRVHLTSALDKTTTVCSSKFHMIVLQFGSANCCPNH